MKSSPYKRCKIWIWYRNCLQNVGLKFPTITGLENMGQRSKKGPRWLSKEGLIVGLGQLRYVKLTKTRTRELKRSSPRSGTRERVEGDYVQLIQDVEETSMKDRNYPGHERVDLIYHEIEMNHQTIGSSLHLRPSRTLPFVTKRTFRLRGRWWSSFHLASLSTGNYTWSLAENFVFTKPL